MADPHPNQPAPPRSGQRHTRLDRPHTRFDRRHLVLLLTALACIGGLVLFVAEMDMDLDAGLTPKNPTPQSSSPQNAPAPAKQP